MAKRLSREERIREIIEAAAHELTENGLGTLTMERIIARTTLSKGGVYRFFSNRREVLLELFRVTFECVSAFDTDEVLSWNLPFIDSVVRIIQDLFVSDREIPWNRVWLQLLPETIHDPAFAALASAGEEAHIAHFSHLSERILERDGKHYREGADLDLIYRSAMTFGAGLQLAALRGQPLSDVIRQMTYLLEVLKRDAIEED